MLIPLPYFISERLSLSLSLSFSPHVINQYHGYVREQRFSILSSQSFSREIKRQCDIEIKSILQRVLLGQTM